MRGASNSNLATPTYFKSIFSSKKPIFSALKNSVADKSGSYASRTPLINKRGYPYHEARLIDFDNHPSKKWYIVFYAYDIGKDILVRKRVGKWELNKIKDLVERRQVAEAEIKGINDDLQNGAYLQEAKKKKPEPELSAFDFHGYTLLDALTYIRNYVRDVEKRTKNTVRQYTYTQNVIQRFIHQDEKLSNKFLLTKLNHIFVLKLVEYMRSDDEDLSNKTHNGVLTVLHSAIEKLRHLDTSLFRVGNPIKVKKLPENSYTHAAYSGEQLAKVAEMIGSKDKQFLLFIRFIYYTLARPKEIRLIKVGHIRMELGQILMAGENAKENKEGYVGISHAFRQIILDSGILDYPQDYYVFSNAITNKSGRGTREYIPGLKPVGANYFSKRYRPYLKELGFKKLNDRYTLYSFKHSGAIQLYLESKDIHLVSKQCRHSSLSQTNTYLQELGLFTNFKGLENWKGF